MHQPGSIKNLKIIKMRKHHPMKLHHPQMLTFVLLHNSTASIKSGEGMLKAITGFINVQLICRLKYGCFSIYRIKTAE